MSRARHGTADALVGATSLCTLVAGAAIISPDIRSQVNAFAGDPVAQLSALASRALDYGNILVRTAGDYTPYTSDSTPFMGFAIVAVVLTLMLFRS